jgi:hypothetical protein
MLGDLFGGLAQLLVDDLIVTFNEKEVCTVSNCRGTRHKKSRFCQKHWGAYWVVVALAIISTCVIYPLLFFPLIIWWLLCSWFEFKILTALSPMLVAILIGILSDF